MGSAWQTTRRLIGIVGRVFLILVALSLFILLLGEPLVRGWWLRHQLLTALDDATSVRVVEHSDRSDHRGFDPNYKEVTYGTVTLTPEQINSLRQALPLRLDYSGTIMLMCIFEEHHYVEFKRRDGTVTMLHLCFHCGQLQLNASPGQNIMPWGWYDSLSAFITSLGLHPKGPWPPIAKSP